MAKKLNLDEMQAQIAANWSAFQQRMKQEWDEFSDDELAEAKQNLHSFIVQVERRTHESQKYVAEKLQQWQKELAPVRR